MGLSADGNSVFGFSGKNNKHVLSKGQDSSPIHPPQLDWYLWFDECELTERELDRIVRLLAFGNTAPGPVLYPSRALMIALLVLRKKLRQIFMEYLDLSSLLLDWKKAKLMLLKKEKRTDPTWRWRRGRGLSLPNCRLRVIATTSWDGWHFGASERCLLKQVGVPPLTVQINVKCDRVLGDFGHPGMYLTHQGTPGGTPEADCRGRLPWGLVGRRFRKTYIYPSSLYGGY